MKIFYSACVGEQLYISSVPSSRFHTHLSSRKMNLKLPNKLHSNCCFLWYKIKYPTSHIWSSSGSVLGLVILIYIDKVTTSITNGSKI